MSRGVVNIAAVVGVLTIVAVLGGLLWALSGGYNVAATDEHFNAVSWALDRISDRSIQVHAYKQDEVKGLPTDSESLQEGFELYREMCLMCHGAPGVDMTAIGLGLHPQPNLLAETAEHLDAREIYWVIENGVKSTGMPAFGPTHEEEELLAMMAFVKWLPGMTQEDYRHFEERAERADDASASLEEDGGS